MNDALITSGLVISQINDDKATVAKLEEFLIDTGSTSSFILESQVPKDFVKKPVSIGVSNAFNNDLCTIENCLQVNVSMDGFDIPSCVFYIIPNSQKLNYPGILGLDILRRFKLNLKGNGPLLLNKLNIKNNLPKCIEIANRPQNPCITAADDEFFEPFESKYVRFWKHDGVKDENFYVTSTNEMISNKLILCTTQIARNFNHPIEIINTTENCIKIKKGAEIGTKVATFEQAILNFLVAKKDIPVIERRTLERDIEKWRKSRDLMVKQVDLTKDIECKAAEAPDRYKVELKNILIKYSWNFSRHPSDAGLSDKYVCEIRLSDEDPIFHRSYPIENHKIEKIDDKLQEMIQAGILSETISSFNSPVLFIPKKNKKIRVVNNYSAGKENSINSKLILPRYPTLPVRAILSKLSSAISRLKKIYPHDKITFFSVDISNAFYTLSIREKHRDFTTFIFADKQLAYQRMCQGLASSPSTFQAFASKILQNLDGQNDFFTGVNYQDDFLILTTERHHNHVVDLLLKRVQEFNVVISLSKCEFFQTECKFLGLNINHEGISADSDKINTLLALKEPNTVKEAQTFCGVLVYFTRLIPNLQALLSPIQKAFKLKKQFRLTDEMRINISTIKEHIRKGVNANHLNYPEDDSNEHIFVSADTSKYRTGGIIGNVNFENDEISNVRVCGYSSKALEEQETFLSSRARELIGLSHAIESFKDLIPTDGKILFFVDHKSLEDITHKPALRTSGGERVRNAYAKLLEYPRCRVIFLPSDDNIIKVVDSLSRHPIDEINKTIFHPKHYKKANDLQVNNTKLSVPRQKIDKNFIKEAQLKSEKFSKIKNDILTSKNGRMNLDYSVESDILFKRIKSGQLLAVVPESAAKEIINYIHILSSHCSEKQLHYQLKKESIWLEGKTKLVKQCVQSCLLCALVHKRYATEPSGEPMKPTFEPYSRIYADIVEIKPDKVDSISESSYSFLTFLDDFSLRATCRFLKQKTSKFVIPAITDLIMEAGAVGQSQIVTDNGPEFVSKDFEECLNTLSVCQSRISPRNSQANRIERFHRTLRSILRCETLTKNNIVQKVTLACHIYNSRPSSSLNGFTPLQTLYNKSPPIYFRELKFDEIKTEYSTPTIDEHLKYLEFFHKSMAELKYDNYFLKGESKSSSLKLNDFVILRDKTPNFSHDANQKGPYIITEVLKHDNFLIKHLYWETKLKRKARFLVKLNLTEEDAKYLADILNIFIDKKNGTIHNSKHPVVDSVKTLLNSNPIDYSPIEANITEERYNLRPRK
jgi:hypothetical protein